MNKVIWWAIAIMIFALASVCTYVVGSGLIWWVHKTKMLTEWGYATNAFGIRAGMIILSVYATILFTPKRE